MIIGIDPGVTGAAAVICDTKIGCDSYICDVTDIPTMPDGRRRQVDARQLALWIKSIGAYHIVIEQVASMPSDGHVGAFRFGMSVGVIHAVCRLLGYEPELVQPAVWKEYFRLIGEDKEAARQLALRLYPEMSDLLERKKDHNRAEAMLIARWAARPPIGRDW